MLSILLRLSLVLILLVVVGLAGTIFVGKGEVAGDGSIADPGESRAELINRGKYLATAGNCVSCHTAFNGAYLAGGLGFETPFGTIYSTNITSDSATGIGAWTQRDFLNAMRHGIRPDGQHLYPVFPYRFYTRITNEDVLAIFAYLKSTPAVELSPEPNSVSFPFNIRPLLGWWKALFFERGAYQPDDNQSDHWNRGAYLVEALAHCGACHSPRNSLGAIQGGKEFSGGEYLAAIPGGALRPWAAPNLTSSDRGLGIWSQSELSAYLKSGRNSFLETYGPMNEVIMNSTRHLTESDVDAMALYLKGIPEIGESAGSVPDQVVMGRGRTIYNLHCGTCHLPTGEGDPEMAPRLNRGSLVVQSDNPASMINAILFSPEPPQPALPEKWRNPMDEFQYLLNDEEVAAVASYVRHSWDNSAGLVTSEQVARQRGERR